MSAESRSVDLIEPKLSGYGVTLSVVFFIYIQLCNHNTSVELTDDMKRWILTLIFIRV